MPGRTPGKKEYTGHQMALGIKVVVDACEREGARIFGKGAWLWTSSFQWRATSS
jgi:hypothetical protein